MTTCEPTLLLTRPRAQAKRFAAQVRATIDEVRVVISPVLTIQLRDAAMDLSTFGGVVLTSENGARALSQVAEIVGMRAWCVGDRTADVAGALGLKAVSAHGDATTLVAKVADARPDEKLLHVHGAETRGDVAARLRRAGITVESVVLYDQVETPLSDAAKAVLSGTAPVIVPLFSPRSAQLVSDALAETHAPLAIVALSPAVADAWTGPDAQIFTVAARPDADHMLKEIATIWTALSA